MSDPILGALFAALATISWAAGAVLARVGMQHVRSSTGTFISLTAGFVTISAVAVGIDWRALLAVSQSTILWFVLLGVIQFPGGRFLNYSGIRLAGVTRATAISGTSPLFAALLAIAFLQEQVTPWILLATLAVAAGLALVMSDQRAFGDSVGNTHPAQTQNSRRKRPRGPVLLGLLCATGGAAAYGTGHTIARHVVTSAASAPVTATYTLFFGMLMLFAISARHLRRDLKAPRSALIMMALAGACSSLGIFFMYTALSRAPVTLASPIVTAYPLVAMTLTHIFLQRLERVTAPMVLGAILVAFGITFVILGRAG